MRPIFADRGNERLEYALISLIRDSSLLCYWMNDDGDKEAHPVVDDIRPVHPDDENSIEHLDLHGRKNMR